MERGREIGGRREGESATGRCNVREDSLAQSFLYLSLSRFLSSFIQILFKSSLFPLSSQSQPWHFRLYHRFRHHFASTIFQILRPTRGLSLECQGATTIDERIKLKVSFIFLKQFSSLHILCTFCIRTSISDRIAGDCEHFWKKQEARRASKRSIRTRRGLSHPNAPQRIGLRLVAMYKWICLMLPWLFMMLLLLYQ